MDLLLGLHFVLAGQGHCAVLRLGEPPDWPPEDPLPSYELLTFNENNAQKGIDLGMKDAKRTIEMGEGEAFKRFKTQFEEGHYNIKRHPKRNAVKKAVL